MCFKAVGYENEINRLSQSGIKREGKKDFKAFSGGFCFAAVSHSCRTLYRLSGGTYR